MSEVKKHTETIEFGLAETIWNTGVDERTKERAIEYYEMACGKNDGAAFLALYKIYVENKNLELKRNDRLRLNIKYLNESIALGYLPALLYAGSEEIFLPYERLVYLAAGMNYAHRNKLPELSDFQLAFANASSKFAAEFIPEILSSNENWEPGKTIRCDQSNLDGLFIQHPKKYEPESDKKRDDWKIFGDSLSTAMYLNMLPGASEYFQACEAEDAEALNQYQKLMDAAKLKGNGQAIYALIEEKNNSNLLDAAQHGSIDAFLDILDKLCQYYRKYEYSFYNTTRIETDDEETFLSALNCFLYIFSIMERLGIAKYCNSFIHVACLASEHELGYEYWRNATANQLKYELCSHELCCQMNNRAYAWKLGDKFDAVFYENFEVVMRALD